MSTTLQEPSASPSAGYVDSKSFISLKLAKTRSTIKSTEIFTSLMGATAMIVGYLFLFVVADHWLVPQGIGYVPRLLLLIGLVTVTSVWLALKVVVPYIKKVHTLYAAQVLEQSDPQFRGNLLNLVDLQRSGRDVSQHIISALEKRAAVKLSETNVEQAVNHRGLLNASYALLALVVMSCLYTVFSPKPITPSILAALLPTPERAVATRTEISGIKPGDTTVLARSQMEVTADILGELPEEVTLHYSTADRKHVDEPIRMHPVEEGLRSYRAIINGENGKGILQNLTYSISAGDAVSPTFSVTVKQPPSATVKSVRLTYPKYMVLDSKSQPGGHIDAWEGTTVRVDATANKPITSALLLFIDEENSKVKAEEISMDIKDGVHLSLEWPLSIRSDGTSPRFYRIQCRDDEGSTDPAPTLYTLNIRPDLPPEVTLHDPTQDLELPANATVPLAVTAQDPDFLLRYVILRVEKEGEPIWEEPLFEGSPQQDFQGFHDFQLKGLNLQPGEIISYWIEAHDNKEPVANRRSTPKLNIRIEEPVTEDEAQKLLEEQKQEQKQKLEEQAQADENSSSEPSEDNGEPQADDNSTGEKSEGDPSDKPSDSGDPQEKPNDPAGSDPSESKDPQPADPEGKDGTPQGQNGDEKQPSPADPADGQSQEQKSHDPKAKNGQAGKQKEPGDSQDPSKSDQLKSDGTDDDEALRRLLDRQKPSPKKDKPTDKPRQGKKDTDKGDKQEGDQTADNEKEGEKDGDATATDKSNDKDMPEENADPKDQDDMPGDEKTGDDTSSDEKSDEDKSGDEKSGDEKSEDKKSEDEKTGGEQPGDEKPGEKNSNNKSDANEGKESDDNDAEGESDQKNKSDAGKKTAPPKSKVDDPQDGEGSDDGEKVDNPKKKPTQKRKGDVKEGEVSEEENPDPNEKSNDSKRKQNESKQKTRKPADTNDNPQDPGKEESDGENDPDQKPNGARPKKTNDPDKPQSDAEEVEESDDSTDGETGDKQSSESGEDIDNEKGLKRKGPKSQGKSSKSDENSKSEGEGEPSDSNSGKSGDSDANKEKEDKEQGDPQDSAKKSDENKDDQPAEKQEPAGNDAGESGSKSDQGEEGGGKGKQPSDQSGSSPDGSKKEGKGGKRDAISKGGNASGEAGPAGDDSPAVGSSSHEIEDAEEANLEDKEKAVNLVLKQLEDQLKRGDVDPQLLKELGWTEEQMHKFVERLQQQMQQIDDESQKPEDVARRIQFEEMLKNLDATGQAQKRTGENVKKTIGNEIGPRRLDVPPEFREAYEAYTKSLSKIKNQPTK
ncbi:MAG: hypothetical protein ACKVT0_14990 [Planctomycetaceae bacterium]